MLNKEKLGDMPSFFPFWCWFLEVIFCGINTFAMNHGKSSYDHGIFIEDHGKMLNNHGKSALYHGKI